MPTVLQSTASSMMLRMTRPRRRPRRFSRLTRRSPQDPGRWPERVVRRVWRRPINWWQRPWTRERAVRFTLTAITLFVTTYVMMNVVHMSPVPSRDLVFDDTTPTGGDFGAHVWGAAYLRDHLLPSGWFNGWSMDWYAGFPAYRYYMVLPALAVLIADVFLPYGVALKLTSVLGLITLPMACWAFGRLAAFRYPIPELFASAGLAFALDESYLIYGGNLKSTMAGEYSFSIALSIAVLALGTLARGLRTGEYRVLTSVLIAAACVSHGVVLIAFVAPSTVIMALIWMDHARLKYALTVGLTSVLLTAWWVLPFLWDHAYQTDMKYGALTNWWELYFPLTTSLDILVTALAAFGFGFSVLRRDRNGEALGIIGLVLAAGVYLGKESIPGLGLLWNLVAPRGDVEYATALSRAESDGSRLLPEVDQRSDDRQVNDKLTPTDQSHPATAKVDLCDGAEGEGPPC